MEFSYDTDPKQAANNHFAWPGYDHVAKVGEGFHCYSEAMNMQL
jgi:hypothetical protein